MIKVKVKSIKESIDDSYTKVLSKLGELQRQGKFPGGSIVGNDINDSLADNEILIKGDDGSDIAGFKSALDQLKVDNTIANYFVNPDDTIIITLKESKKKSKKEKGIRIARYGEFDNGYVLHNFEDMDPEDAEMKAKDASLKDPNDIYYVAYDDLMNSDSDYRWINGKKYNYSQVGIQNGKPYIK